MCVCVSERKPSVVVRLARRSTKDIKTEATRDEGERKGKLDARRIKGIRCTKQEKRETKKDGA